LLRNKTEQIIDKKFFKHDPIRLGQKFTDPLSVILDRKTVEIIVENTFEEQVRDLKEDSLKLLIEHFNYDDTIKLVEF